MCSIMGYCGDRISLEKFTEHFERTKPRGPDASKIIRTGCGLLGLHLLAFMDLHENKRILKHDHRIC